MSTPSAALGTELMQITTYPAVTPYPTFTDCQATMYAALVAAFNQSEGSSVTDLRTDVYPDPILYPPDQVYSVITAIQQPDLGSCEASDWTVVYDQIRTEAKYLQDLYDFQTSFQIGTLGVADAMNLSFTTAQDTIDDDSTNGNVSLLSILGSIASAASGVFEAPAAIFTILGAYCDVASSIAGAIMSAGDMSSLQTQLSATIDQMNTAAGNLYAPICLDWGRLQQFAALLPSLQAQATQNDYNTIGDQYEISLYQAVCPSTMAIVWFPGSNSSLWGSCGSPSDSTTALAYIPVLQGDNGCNNTLCSRLTTLGVDLDDVVSRSGGWSGFQYWECISTFKGTYCERKS